MSISQYIRWTDTTAIYPQEREQEYLRLGLLSEVGEVAGVLKRRVRDGETAPEKLLAEVGDLLWYLARLHRNSEIWSEAAELDAKRNGDHQNSEIQSFEDIDTLVKIAALTDGPVPTVARFLQLLRRHDLTLEEVIASNTAKLEGRKQRNTIQGAGDER